MKTMAAKWNGFRRDLQDGREWLVKSERSGMTYAVVFYSHNGQRWGYCSCPAGSREVFCRHLPWAAACDSQLIKTPQTLAA